MTDAAESLEDTPSLHARSVRAANAAVQGGDLAAAKAHYGAAWRSADVGTLVVGDSHVFTFLEAGHVLPVWLGAVTMHRVGRDGPAFLTLSELQVQRGLDVVFCFGEIDVRAHVARQAETRSIPVEAVVTELVDRYLDALDRICDRPGARVFVATPVPPRSPAAGSPHAAPDLSPLTGRIAVARILAETLANGVLGRGLGLIDLHAALRDPDGLMRAACGSDGVHAYTPEGRRIAADLLLAAQGGTWTRSPLNGGVP
jgi:hypothetical protein